MLATRFNVACCDPSKCWMRECMWVGEDKGTFVLGRGYTSYHAQPKPQCMTREREGCPSPLPTPDPENARCCYAPTYKGRGKMLICSTCGATAPNQQAKLLAKLPRLQGVPCTHQAQTTTLIQGWRECPTCQGFWQGSTGVSPHEAPTHTLTDMLTVLRCHFKVSEP